MNFFLIAAYALIWLALVGYLAVLGHQQRRLRQQVDSLEQQLRRISNDPSS